MTLIIIIIIITITASVFILFDRQQDGSDEFGQDYSIIGIGEAKGVYIVKAENYYIVVGKKVKNGGKAMKLFLEFVDENGYMPLEMYFFIVKDTFHDYAHF